MRTSTKMTAVALAVAVPALLVGRIIWPDGHDITQPTAVQMPWFILLAAIEAIAFGIGVAFLIYGWPLMNRAKINKKGRVLLFIAIAWQLLSWWPHDNMHRHNGMEIAGLLRIEYMFHLTLIVSALIIAWFFWQALIPDSEKPPSF